MLEKRCQGRRARGDAEIGSERIVTGMREAIRQTGTSRLSRKDIADFAGVTPPLVTYYFADRDALLEAATLPVTKGFAESVSRCLSQQGSPERVLRDIIEFIVEFRVRDGAVLDAYARLRALGTSQKPNPLMAVDNMLRSFFESWLKDSANAMHFAKLAQMSLVSMCKYLPKKAIGPEKYQCEIIYWVIMCIVGSSDSPPASAMGVVDDEAHKVSDIA